MRDYKVAAGGGEDATVARLLNPQGSLDPSYGGGSGWSRLDAGGSENGNAIVLQPDGRIIVALRNGELLGIGR